MKKLMLLFLMSVCIISCNQSSGSKSNDTDSEETEEATELLTLSQTDVALEFINRYVHICDDSDEVSKLSTASEILIPSGKTLFNLCLSSPGLILSESSSSIYSAKLSIPKDNGFPIENFGCGLKPSVYLTGKSAFENARVKSLTKSRWDRYLR